MGREALLFLKLVRCRVYADAPLSFRIGDPFDVLTSTESAGAGEFFGSRANVTDQQASTNYKQGQGSISHEAGQIPKKIPETQHIVLRQPFIAMLKNWARCQTSF